MADQYQSTEEYDSSSSEDFVYFQSINFFFDMNTLYLLALGVIHLSHWIINLVVEYKNTKSCGTSQRLEGVVGYILLGVSFSIPVLCSIWIIFALPDWSYLPFGPSMCCKFWIAIAWIGTLLAIIDVIAFGYVHYGLGINWSGTVTLKTNHELVTTGPYRFARHPMYTVLLFLPLITLMMTSCWLWALAWVLALIYPVSRCRKEERLMQQTFGDEYRDYMDKVGPFFPFPFPQWGNKVYDVDYTNLVSDNDFIIEDDDDLFNINS